MFDIKFQGIETYSGNVYSAITQILLLLIFKKELQYGITFVQSFIAKTEAHRVISPLKNELIPHNQTGKKSNHSYRECMYLHLQMPKKNDERIPEKIWVFFW